MKGYMFKMGAGQIHFQQNIPLQQMCQLCFLEGRTSEPPLLLPLMEPTGNALDTFVKAQSMGECHASPLVVNQESWCSVKHL